MLAANAARFPKLDLFPVTLVAKDWEDAQRRFFDDGGGFDRIAHAPTALPAAGAAR